MRGQVIAIIFLVAGYCGVIGGFLAMLWGVYLRASAMSVDEGNHAINTIICGIVGLIFGFIVAIFAKGALDE